MASAAVAEPPAGDSAASETMANGGPVKLMDHIFPETTADVRRRHGAAGMPSSDYFIVDGPQAHHKRHVAILKAHPEVKQLITTDPAVAWWIIAVNVLQFGLAWAVQRYFSWPAMLVLSYTVGATAMHAMWVLVHECTHNVVHSSPLLNNLFLLLANSSIIFPSVVSFKHYHLRHHQHLNDVYSDPDLPGPWEINFAGNSALGKALWLAGFPIFMSLRMLRYLQKHNPPTGWVVANIISQAIVILSVYQFIGLKALVYLTISSYSSISLHPFGARWIQEHYAFLPQQETYSYYGIGNLFCFNIGYHNEHHDFTSIPASKLPALKSMASEFYDPLYSHTSYITLLWKFITDPSLTLRSRVVRETDKSIRTNFW
eukprot:jgi/Chlat1/8983/Chrsp94S08275